MIDKTNNQFGKYNGNEYKYVLEALDSENKNRFNFVEKFENAFREKMKSKYLENSSSVTGAANNKI